MLKPIYCTVTPSLVFTRRHAVIVSIGVSHRLTHDSYDVVLTMQAELYTLFVGCELLHAAYQLGCGVSPRH